MIQCEMNRVRQLYPRGSGASWRVAALAAALAGVLGAPGTIQPGGFGLSAAMAQPAGDVKSVADVKAMLDPTLPANADEITSAMTTAKIGGAITIRGYVPDAEDAFSEAAAEFTLVSGLPATKAPARATVRVVDGQGRIIKGSLRDQHGLKAGAEVFVMGTVVAADGKDILVMTAASMHIPRTPLPTGFFTDMPAENARDVSEARRAGTMKVGDEVVLRGRIGGSKEPFVAGRAVFTLMGRALKACNENPDDKCSRPWDYCCETRADILANSVTIQVVDARSQVLRTDMKGRRGIKELSEVVVIGKVAVADGKAVVVNATSMHAVP